MISLNIFDDEKSSPNHSNLPFTGDPLFLRPCTYLHRGEQLEMIYWNKNMKRRQTYFFRGKLGQ